MVRPTWITMLTTLKDLEDLLYLSLKKKKLETVELCNS